MTGLVRKIIRFSYVDGPGNRAVIFLQGCNLNCVYCHNPETIPRQDTPEAKTMSPQQVFDEIGSAKAFIRGITMSGGECTLQNGFVTKVFQLAKEKNLSTFIDSNGTYDFSQDKSLLDVTDAVMLDIKSTSLPPDISFLGVIGKLYEIRTVIYESMPEAKALVTKAAKAISPFNTHYKLIRFRPHGVRSEYIKKLTPPSNATMQELQQTAYDSGAKKVIIQ